MLIIPRAVMAQSYDIMHRCGNERAECVTYMLGPASDPTVVDEVLHPKHIGTPTYYKVDDHWLNAVWLDLARRGKSIRVQVHTHRGMAFHSPTDDRWPVVHTEGFLSLVIPNFAKGSSDLTGVFLAELLADGRWRACHIAEKIRIS